MIYFATEGSCFLVFVFWIAGVVWGINLLWIILRSWVKWLKDWWEEEKEEEDG